ncbi:hypothetical protein SC171_21565 [Pantoea cypripedii]|uniref:hypothetical protein n=1 Tax=Pantoea cypripedii TaxID=55209 RepID=UPI002FC6527E
MADITRSYNLHQQYISVNEEKRRNEDQNDQQPPEPEISQANELNAIGDEIAVFISRLRQQQHNLEKKPALCEQFFEDCADLKLRLSRALLENQIFYFQSSDVAIRKDNYAVLQLSEQLLEAESLLEEVEGKAAETNNKGLMSVVVEKALFKQENATSLTGKYTLDVQQDTNAVEQQDNNPLLRAAPTEDKDNPEDKSINTAETASEDVSTIGQDKMTPEEKLWHELSIVLAGIAALEDMMNELIKLVDLIDNNHFDVAKQVVELRNKFKAFLDKNPIKDGYLTFKIPEGMSQAQVKALLDKAGIAFLINNDGDIALKDFDASYLVSLLNNMDYAVDYFDRGEITGALNMVRMARNSAVAFMQDFKLPEYIKAVNTYYPVMTRPETDDSTLSGWLAGMLPAFDGIDKSNVTFYKSLISLITAWQSKINEFNKKYAEVLKSSDGVNKDDSKHRFNQEKVNEMLAVLDDITAMEYQMAVILGGVTEADLANLLEGTGINYTELVGTVALINLGDDIVKMLKDAVSSCFNQTNEENYLVTPEQLTQFNNVLSQAQTQFDTVVKKVNTKTDSAKTLFNDTKEALSNLIKTAESLLADLAKMIR